MSVINWHEVARTLQWLIMLGTTKKSCRYGECRSFGSLAVFVLFFVCFVFFLLFIISRVSDQNGVSLLYIMLEIHHSGREPSISCGIMMLFC